jgi:hypothetical protein
MCGHITESESITMIKSINISGSLIGGKETIQLSGSTTIKNLFAFGLHEQRFTAKK